MKYFLVLLPALLCAAAANAAPLPRVGTFVYSSLCWSQESGDASGYRIKLVRTEAGDRLDLEWSEGPLEGPQAATDVTIDAATGALSFVMHFPQGTGETERYRGHITAAAVDLQSPFGGHSTVRRVRPASEKIKACPA